MIDIEKMFTLIAARPQIRTVEIAELIDCDSDQVQPALQPHIDSGNLTLIEVTAPNGRPANGFMLTRKFMAGELYQALLPAIQEQRTADGWVKPAPPPAPKPVAPRAPEQSMTAPGVQRAARRPAPPDDEDDPDVHPTAPAPRAAVEPARPYDRSATQKAIDYLAQHGPSKASDLRQPMGLSSRQYPMNSLRATILAGRIVRHGDILSLPGAALPAAESAAVAPAQPLTEIAPAGSPPAAFRFARWSDGSIELHRGGKVVMTLTPAECVQLAPSVVLTTMEAAQ
jgi:hypothetical protein